MPYPFFALLLAVLLLAGCGPARNAADSLPTQSAPAPTEMPTEAPTEAPAESPTEATAAQPTPTPAATTAAATTVIEFWSTDTQPERVAAYQAVAERFMAAHPGIQVQIVPVEEAQVSLRLAEAATQNALPDIVRLGVERTVALQARGLLDEAAAAAVVRAVGVEDFRSGPLQMVTNSVTDRPFAVPFDGWLGAIWYRKDLFDSLGLAAPVTWDQVEAACDALLEAEELTYALALPTAPDDNYVHQIFEQIAMSNNAWPFDGQGRPAFDTPAMVEALRFYLGLARCAPPGVDGAPAAAQHYLLGDSGMLFYSTYVMDDLVDGVVQADGSRVQPVYDDLAQRTGFSSSLVGPGGTAAYGQLVTLAMLQGADPAAQAVASFFLGEGYLEILALAPLGKVPVLQSATEPWMQLSPIFANYSAATLGHIANGYDTMQRWVLRPEYTDLQQALIGEVEGNLLIPQAIDAMVRGEMTPEAAAQWLQEQVEALGRQ